MAELQHLMVSGQQQHGNGKTFAPKHQQTNEPKHQNTKHQQTKTPTYQTGHFLRQKQTQTKRKILEEYKNGPELRHFQMIIGLLSLPMNEIK